MCQKVKILDTYLIPNLYPDTAILPICQKKSIMVECFKSNRLKTFLQNVFTESAHWADSVIESQFWSVCLFVCLFLTS